MSVEIERLMFSAKNHFFFIELIHSRLHPVNFRVQLRKMNKVVILGENIVRSGNSQDQRVLAGLVKNSGNLWKLFGDSLLGPQGPYIPLKYKSRNGGKLITMKQPQMVRLRTKVP